MKIHTQPSLLHQSYTLPILTLITGHTRGDNCWRDQLWIQASTNYKCIEFLLQLRSPKSVCHSLTVSQQKGSSGDLVEMQKTNIFHSHFIISGLINPSFQIMVFLSNMIYLMLVSLIHYERRLFQEKRFKN